MKIKPISFLKGEIKSSPSKSYSHRVIFLSSFAKTPSYIINPLIEGDVKVTLDFCKNLGANFEVITNPQKEVEFNQTLQHSDILLKITPLSELKPLKNKFNVKNSGTSTRIICSILPLLNGKSTIYGEFFNRERPIKILLDVLTEIGLKWIKKTDPKGLEFLQSELKPSNVSIRGDISSQFITSLLFLSIFLKSTTVDKQNMLINISTPVSSFYYLKITEDIFSSFKINFKSKFNKDFTGNYNIPCNQAYNGINYRIPGDFSSAAFILVAAALNPLPETVTITNLSMNSLQSDKGIVFLLKEMNTDLEIDSTANSITISGGKFLKGLKIDCKQIPDLFPILCVLGLFCDKNTILFNINVVRNKESDRVAIMLRELRKMGAIIKELEDAILIEGPQQLRGSTINHDNDHRIAMAMTIAAMFARSDSNIENTTVVKDSYPKFFEDLKKLGGNFLMEK